MAITKTIETIQISKTEFQELAGDILTSMVSGNNSPFNDMMDKFEGYLETSSDLDPTQQAAAYADMLKSTYEDINKQALTSAMDLLKSNEQLVLERYQTEIAYNKGLKDLIAADEQTALAAKQVIGQGYNNTLALEKIKESRLAQATAKAELEKQWGQSYSEGSDSVVVVDDGLGTVTTTTTHGTGTITPTGADNVIDKQIRGFDMVNLKDILKTMDERAALMQNAKIGEPDADRKTRAELLYAVTSGNVSTLAGFVPKTLLTAGNLYNPETNLEEA